MTNKETEDKIVRCVLKTWHKHPVWCKIIEDKFIDNFYDVFMILKDGQNSYFKICSHAISNDGGDTFFATDTHRVSDYLTKEEWKEIGYDI